MQNDQIIFKPIRELYTDIKFYTDTQT